MFAPFGGAKFVEHCLIDAIGATCEWLEQSTASDNGGKIRDVNSGLA